MSPCFAIVAANGSERVTVSTHKSFVAACRAMSLRKNTATWRAAGYALSVEKCWERQS